MANEKVIMDRVRKGDRIYFLGDDDQVLSGFVVSDILKKGAWQVRVSNRKNLQSVSPYDVVRVVRTMFAMRNPSTATGKGRGSKGVVYRGITFPGYNQPIKSSKPEKKMMVLAKEGGVVRLIHFGDSRYGHNYSPEARKSYLRRSAGIPGADSKLYANYWARKVLWAGKGGSMKRPPQGQR